MKSLRQVIRKLILESEGIQHYEVDLESDLEGGKRYSGHYAKKLFAKKADFAYLNSLTYIHTKTLAKVDRFIAMNNRDELSCIVIEDDVYNGVLQVPYDIGQLLTAPRIGFIIKGRPTWVQNKNAATGHSGTLLRTYHKGKRPESGVNKAPSKMHGGGLPWHALDGVILDEEDAENHGLFGWSSKDPNKNNEALIDNWECTHVIKLIRHTDKEDTITDEYHAMIDEIFQKCKERWPKCELIEGEVD